MKILAVEDDPSVLEVTKKRLELAGYEVITAMEGLEGLKKARSENPDLIVLDLKLPNLNGYQISWMLKRDMKYRHIPIIMLTSLTEEKDIIEGFRAGADFYITKPYDADALMIQIKTLLEQRPREKPAPPAPVPKKKPKKLVKTQRRKPKGK
jgi:two-component system alkaline phosphatase synthesis response regulator PhoP